MSHDLPQRLAVPSREMSLLLACAPSCIDGRSNASIPELSTAPLDWRQWLALAIYHRLAAMAYAALNNAHASSVPPPVLAELRSLYLNGARQSLFLSGQLTQLLELLDSNAIPVIPFKGPLLAAEVYGDLAMRACGDLDLLVHRDDAVRARQLLMSRGFTPVFPTATPSQAAYLRSLPSSRQSAYVRSHAEHHLLSADGRVNVDLHWAIALSEFALPLNCRQLWDNARRVHFGGTDVLCLGDEDLLLTLCVNGAKDGWMRLDRICDVAAFLARRPPLDWSRFLDRARAAGAGRIVLLNFWLAHELLGAPIDQTLAVQSPLPQLAQTIRARLLHPRNRPVHQRSLDDMLFQFRLRDRLRDKIRYLAAQSAPTVGDWAALPLPHALHFLYYLLRPIRLLTRTDAAP